MNEQKNASGAKVEGGAWTDNVWAIGTVMLVVGLAIGFFMGRLWQLGGPVSDNDLQGTFSTSTAISTNFSTSSPIVENIYKSTEAAATVSIDDQRAGSLVFVKHTDVSKPTWVAVREISDEGKVGNILGAEMVTSATDDVPVSLLRATKAGESYGVYLYQDDGDGEYNFKKDLLVMQNDNPVSATFVAQ